jgi:hypothetical protein
MPDSALGLDIDGTITSAPEYFSALSRRWRSAGGKVQVISSRSDCLESRIATLKELPCLGIEFDELHLLRSPGKELTPCPYGNLDWFQVYLWQKVAIAQSVGASVYFDDDEKVVWLFRRYAPEIRIVHIGVDDLPAIADLLQSQRHFGC